MYAFSVVGLRLQDNPRVYPSLVDLVEKNLSSRGYCPPQVKIATSSSGEAETLPPTTKQEISTPDKWKWITESDIYKMAKDIKLSPSILVLLQILCLTESRDYQH
jgi:hypothetical protein